MAVLKRQSALYHPAHMDFTPAPHLTQNWQLAKPAASGARGMVVSQSKDAAEAGVAVLDAGGNAIDAAVATALALATVEPWNSGLGGIGHALVHRAGQARAEAVDFGPTAPAALDPSRFKLTGRVTTDLFAWPEVEGDTNIHGPLSFAIPSAVAGYAEMHKRWGKLPLAEIATPAIALARRGLPQDWYTALKVAVCAPVLRKYPESARIYLRDGLPPVPPYQGTFPYFRLGRLSETLERLAQAGWRDFYEGEIAASIAADVRAMGGVLSAQDLAACRARVLSAVEVPWRARTLQLAGPLTAAPTATEVLRRMASVPFGRAPDAAWYVALARALKAAYVQRLASLGDAEPQAAESCTTHITVCDAEGTMVAMTTTLLSSMGSRVVLPETGVLMNNGVMWFDPRAGPAELDRAGQAAAHQHVPGDPARRREAVDRCRRIGWPAHHGGRAAAHLVRHRFRHDAGGGRAPAAHRRLRSRQGDGGPPAFPRDHRRAAGRRAGRGGRAQRAADQLRLPEPVDAAGRRAHRHQRRGFAVVGGGRAGVRLTLRRSPQ